LGGLTAGALLAQSGHRVTILEQHNIIVGCATTPLKGEILSVKLDFIRWMGFIKPN